MIWFALSGLSFAFLLIAYAVWRIAEVDDKTDRRLTELEAWTRKNMTPEP